MEKASNARQSALEATEIVKQVLGDEDESPNKK